MAYIPTPGAKTQNTIIGTLFALHHSCAYISLCTEHCGRHGHETNVRQGGVTDALIILVCTNLQILHLLKYFIKKSLTGILAKLFFVVFFCLIRTSPSRTTLTLRRYKELFLFLLCPEFITGMRAV